MHAGCGEERGEGGRGTGGAAGNVEIAIRIWGEGQTFLEVRGEKGAGSLLDAGEVYCAVTFLSHFFSTFLRLLVQRNIYDAGCCTLNKSRNCAEIKLRWESQSWKYSFEHWRVDGECHYPVFRVR